MTFVEYCEKITERPLFTFERELLQMYQDAVEGKRDIYILPGRGNAKTDSMLWLHRIYSEYRAKEIENHDQKEIH